MHRHSGAQICVSIDGVGWALALIGGEWESWGCARIGQERNRRGYVKNGTEEALMRSDERCAVMALERIAGVMRRTARGRNAKAKKC